MELDGFSEPLKLAFEYQGLQHYKLVSFFHSDQKEFERRQQDDERKRQLCREHGITLLEVPHHIPHDELQKYLADRLNGLMRGLVQDNSVVKLDKLNVWLRRDLDELKAIAAERGGRLVSKHYINSQTKLRWSCAKGHTWDAIPNSIRRGSWCAKCRVKEAARKRAYAIEDMQRLAFAKGGLCLSTSYGTGKSRLLWRCGAGHEWETQASVVIGGHWCLRCESIRLGRQYALTIEDMQSSAKQRGGECLSQSYLNNRQKLLWRCTKGHKWEATGNSIRNGSWCPTCAGKRPKPSSKKRTAARTMTPCPQTATSSTAACASPRSCSGRTT